MTEAGLDIKDPASCNRFPPLGGVRWHRVVLDVRPHTLFLCEMKLRPMVWWCHVAKLLCRASCAAESASNVAEGSFILALSACKNGRRLLLGSELESI